MHKLRGDTLIEVTLAVGIFSMVAVAVVSVVNSSTSGAQSALETTLTREEIDAQAEAIRFIQSSYIASRNTAADDKYAGLWQAITSRAKSINEDESIISYRPATCDELYNSTLLEDQGAFIIDTNNLNSDDISKIVLRAGESEVFHPSSTYPHIIYTTKEDTILDQGTGTIMDRAEGIYVVGVKDPGSTTIVTGQDYSSISQKSAYYDFYIRTCWYGPGAERPSTISTVIRLYDPNAADN